MLRTAAIRLLTSLLLSAAFAADLWSAETDPGNDAGGDGRHATGCVPPTPAQREWERKHMIITRRVRLNALGLERVNGHRRKQGKRPLTAEEVGVAPLGQETEGATAEVLEASGLAAEPQAGELPGLPTYVDNSTLKYFPPVRSQGGVGSCAQWAGMYYCYTHMNAMARDLDAKAGGSGNNSYIFSPKFTYNLVNGGSDSGSWYTAGWSIAARHGCAVWADWPYDSNYRAWPLAASIYRNAINYRSSGSQGTISSCDTATGLNQLKTYLSNGYVLAYATDIYGWQYKAIGDDPATSADDAFVGKSACYYAVVSSSGHAMTVVGYNDDIWIDINGNGTVDSGEKGALRICNSWGTGWGEGGFRWLAYDALKATSAVDGGPSANRVACWWSNNCSWVTARAAYTPKMVAEFTLNHLKRNQLRVNLGLSDTTATTPASSWSPSYLLSYAGGAYAFDGTTTAVNGTFVMDFTDLVPATTTPKRWHVGMYDSTANDVATISSYKLYEATGSGDVLVGTCSNTPKTADGGQQAYVWVDYTYNSGNIAPNAVMTATPVSGQEPLTVNFSGAGSTDPDGTIAAYSWNFGDGMVGSGVTASHTYTSAGTFSATLTVTDNKGGQSSTSKTITVTPDPSKKVFVKSIDMSLVLSASGDRATATVLIHRVDGQPCANATVTGSWSGLVSGASSGVTAADGTVALQSQKSKSTGTFTFTVTGVSVTGWYYDSALNEETSGSISNGGSNQAPTVAAAAAASPNPTGTATTALSVLGADDQGEAALTYTWEDTAGPAAVSFSPNGSNSAKNSTATFSAAGSYTLRATIRDAGGLSVTSSVAVTVSQTLTSVTVSPASASVNPGATRQFTASARDQFGAAMASQPGFGWSVSGGGTISASGLFTAGLPAGGPYTVTASGGGKSGTAAVTVLNVAPVANGQSVTTAEDTGKAISLVASDDNGDSLSWYIVTGPAHGTLGGSGASRTYTPTADYNGPDSFTFRVKDASVYSNTATVSITVTAVNDAPIANPQNVTLAEDTSKAITLTASDVDGDALSYSIVGGPTHGALSGTPPSVTYQPDPGYSGPDSFTFKAEDGKGGSDSEGVNITVTPVNDDPVISTYSPATPFSMVAGTSQVFQVWPHDDDGDPLSYSWKIDGAGVGEADSDLGYSPVEADVGSHTLTVTVSDGKGGTASHSWAVTVTGGTTPVITLSTSTLSTSCAQGASPASQSFTVKNSGTGTLSWSVSDNQTWLSCSPTSGTSTGEADTINMNYSTAALASGTYNATITVSAAGCTSKTIAVTVVVGGTPAITLSPTTLAPSCRKGTNASSQSFTVKNTGGGTLSWSASDNQTWLSCSPASGSLGAGSTATVTVNYGTSALNTGTYGATITVSGGSGVTSKTIAVTLTVIKPGRIKTSVASVSVSTKKGSNPASSSFTIENEGVGTMSYALAEGSSWLSCDPPSGDVSTEADVVTLNYTASSLAAGTYTGAITITAPDADNSPLTLPITLTVTEKSDDGGGGGGGGGGCSLSGGGADPAGWLLPYLGLALAWLAGRRRRR